MGQPTEQADDDVKVIAIKLPFDLQERLLAFPFLHAIRFHYPDAEIHFITPKKNIEVLNLLPFTAFYHEFDEDEIKTIFDVHRFCVNSKIFNVDLFFCLTNSFADACLGLGLRAKKRVGFSDGWKTLVLNQKTKRPVNHHLSEDFYELYRIHIGAAASDRLKVMSRDLPPILKEWEGQPYLALNLWPPRNGAIAEEWVDVLNHLEGQRVAFFCSEDQDKMQTLIADFLLRLSKKNIYFNFVYLDWIELGKMLAYAKGVITTEGPAATFSAYLGSRTLAIYQRQDPRRNGPFYFLSDVNILEVKAPANSPRSFDAIEVFGRASEFFKL